MICIGIQYSSARHFSHTSKYTSIWGSPTSLSSQTPTLQIKFFFFALSITSHEHLRSSIPTVSTMIVKKLDHCSQPPAHSTALVPSTLASTGCLPYFLFLIETEDSWLELCGDGNLDKTKKQRRSLKKEKKRKKKRAQVEKTAEVKSKSEDSHKKEKSAAYQLKNWVWLSTMKGEKRPTIWRMIIPKVILAMYSRLWHCQPTYSGKQPRPHSYPSRAHIHPELPVRYTHLLTKKKNKRKRRILNLWNRHHGVRGVFTIGRKVQIFERMGNPPLLSCI